jgi:small subunit ribosomal protein S2
MKKVPDIVFAIDGAFEVQALREANSLKLPSLAVLNTNGDPDRVEAFIPANTNSVKSIDYIASELKSCLSGVKVSSKAIPRKLTDKKTFVKPVTGTKVEAKADETKAKAKAETKESTVKKEEK